MTAMTFWARAEQMSAEVRAEAKQIDPAKVAFTLLMLPFVVVGFLIANVFKVAWQVVSFCWVAGLVGYRYAGGPGIKKAPGS